MNNPDFDLFQPKYPLLLKEYPRCSFGVGEGWYPLLHELFAVLEHHLKYLSEEVRSEYYVVQVKEKFSLLRVYLNKEDEFMTGAIAMAEGMSGKICEECGLPGQRRSGSWIRTLCNVCWEKGKTK